MKKLNDKLKLLKAVMYNFLDLFYCNAIKVKTFCIKLCYKKVIKKKKLFFCLLILCLISSFFHLYLIFLYIFNYICIIMFWLLVYFKDFNYLKKEIFKCCHNYFNPEKKFFLLLFLNIMFRKSIFALIPYFFV